MRAYVKNLKSKIGEDVEVWGWVYRHRTTKNAAFIVLRDSTGIVQIVFKPDNPNFEQASKLSIESSIKVSGKVKEDPRAPGGIEISGEKLEIVQRAERFPITKDQSTEFLLDIRHLWLRSQRLTKVLKVRARAMEYFREFFSKNGFWEVHPPIITKTGAEGGSTLFPVNYFGEKAYLPQTAQLYLEALIYVLEKVYSLTPSFRAEKSRTRKHLAEFWHLEAEAAWFSNDDNMKLQEEMVSYVVQRLLENEKKLIEDFRDPRDLKGIEPPFERLRYDEAIEILQKKGFDIKWGDDFGAPHERALTEDFEKPVFVYEWPKEVRAFYMKLDEKDPKYVKGGDLLVKGVGEITTGSERIWDVNELLARMEEEGLPRENYEWYIDLRRYGSVPHSGFGLGTDRFIMWILGLEHIRDALPFPRTINRVYP